MICWCHGW